MVVELADGPEEMLKGVTRWWTAVRKFRRDLGSIGGSRNRPIDPTLPSPLEVLYFVRTGVQYCVTPS